MRKKPAQERSSKMVDLILEEAGKIVEDFGMEALTTNLLAKQAKISVGSLYQYFSGREDILRALTSSFLLELENFFLGVFDDKNLRTPLAEITETFLTDGLELNLRHPGLKRIIFSPEAPKGIKSIIEESNQRIMETVVAFIQKRSVKKMTREKAVLCFQVTSSLFKAFFTAVCENPSLKRYLSKEYIILVAQFWERTLT